jgi:hypothetical protein
MFDVMERLMGEKFERSYVDSKKIIEDAHKRLEEGDQSAAYATIETGFVTGRYSGHLEKEGPLANELLGVPRRNLENVLRDTLYAVKGVDFGV